MGIQSKDANEEPGNSVSGESIHILIAMIRNSKKYSGESFDENHYLNFKPVELKKEYFRLFERLLSVRARRVRSLLPPA